MIPTNAPTQTQPREHAHNDWVSDPVPDNLQNLDNLDLQQSNESENTLDEGKNPSAFAEAVQANSPFNTKRPFHSGDRQGLVHSVMEICSGKRSNMSSGLWFQIRAPESEKVWETHDWVYLQSKGAFDLPSIDVCDSLIRAYFEHVHPLLPIIDASHFLSQYTLKGASSMNLLLLWSVFLAAANFASPETLLTAGYPSRKALKRAMYTRVKALYDSDYEDDKVCVVQAVTLLGFWYSDAEDRNGPWHWLGIAIGLCQVMGLHRQPPFTLAGPATELRQRLFRRIWWSCFLRDRWLSVGLGRPMRINLDDCDVQMPEAEDLTAELGQLAIEVANRYLPGSMDEHAIIWVKLIKLSHILGRIIRVDYGLSCSDAGSDHLQALEAELEDCRLPRDWLPVPNSDSLTLNRLQFDMLLEAVTVVLYRPAINFQNPPGVSKDPGEVEALEKARAAAARTNHLVGKLINSDMVHYLRPMKSSRPLARNFARSKLGECMMIVSELRNTYWGADFTFKLFETAQNILKNAEDPTTGDRTVGGQNVHAGAQSNSGEGSDTGQGQLNLDAFNHMDWSNLFFDQTYNEPPNNESADPALVTPWSLDEFQNMFGIPFALDGSDTN
ncbi:hypothetical protein AYO22_01510 [Fonsecaea multimorphosa]|nr:hypothetical protein AYO22_01510 [Fonsecaea multimorphosa]